MGMAFTSYLPKTGKITGSSVLRLLLCTGAYPGHHPVRNGTRSLPIYTHILCHFLSAVNCQILTFLLKASKETTQMLPSSRLMGMCIQFEKSIA